MALFKKKNYRLFDYLCVVYSCCPVYCIINIIKRVINALIPSFQALAVADLVDNAIILLAGKNTLFEVIKPLIVLMVLSSYSYISSALISVYDAKQKMRLKERIAVELIKKRASIQYKCIENEEEWGVITRSCDNANERFWAGFNNLIGAVELIVRILSIIIVIWVKMWWVAIVIILISVPLMWLAYISGKASYKAFREADKYERRSNYLAEVLTERKSTDERTLFQFTKTINYKWLKTNEVARGIKLRVERGNYIKMKGSSVITAILSFIIIGLLLVPVSKNLMTIGLFIALSNQIQSIIHTMSWDLTDLIESITNSVEYLKDFSRFMYLPEVRDNILPLKDFGITVNDIEFNNVSFKYPGREEYILKNISFKLTKGKAYAFVGPNGAGKTTIIKILTGLYDNYEGIITINNRDLRNFTSQELRSLFSIVYQDFAKYQISIREFLQLGLTHATTDDEMIKALSLVGLYSFSNKQPLDLDINLGKIRQHASDVSGGQWQKIAIAHAILQSAPIQVLDEPTSSLDPIAESRLYADYRKIMGSGINILITHRLGAARIADEILVIKDGHIIERGNHKDLLSNSGFYTEMFESQKGWYI